MFGIGRVGAEQAPRRPTEAQKERVCMTKERISRMPPYSAGKRSSIYSGVTRYVRLLPSLCRSVRLCYLPVAFDLRTAQLKRLDRY